MELIYIQNTMKSQDSLELAPEMQKRKNYNWRLSFTSPVYSKIFFMNDLWLEDKYLKVYFLFM